MLPSCRPGRQRQDEAWQLNVKCQILQAEIDKLREAAAETEALLHRGSESLDTEREPLPFVAIGQTWRNTKTSQNYVVINVGALCKFGDEWIETVLLQVFGRAGFYAPHHRLLSKL